MSIATLELNLSLSETILANSAIVSLPVSALTEATVVGAFFSLFSEVGVMGAGTATGFANMLPKLTITDATLCPLDSL